MLELNLKYGYSDKINKHTKYMKTSELPFKIEPFTPHYLRHTFATMLYLQNTDVVEAMQILGHTDVQTTINIYTDFKNLNKNNLSESYKQLLLTDFAVKTA